MKDVKENKDNIVDNVDSITPEFPPVEKPGDGEPQAEAEQTARDPRARYNIFALIGIILAVIAWVILSLQGWAALFASVLSFISACIGLRASTRAWRNTAITAIVSSAVLMVVLSAFLIVIYIGLDSL